MEDHKEYWEEKREKTEEAVKGTGKILLKKAGKVVLKKGGKIVLKKGAKLLTLLSGKVLLILILLILTVGFMLFLLSEGAEKLMWGKYTKLNFEKTAWNLVKVDTTIRDVVRVRAKEVGFLVAIVENEFGGFKMTRDRTIRVEEGGKTTIATPEYVRFVRKMERTARRKLPLYFRFGAFLPDSGRAFSVSHFKERWNAELLFKNRNNLVIALRILDRCMEKCGGFNVRSAMCYAYTEDICEGLEMVQRLKALATTAKFLTGGGKFLELLR